jgi:hypothetical protein
MRTLAFDGQMGASGDMILASLLDAGGDPDVLHPVEATLGVRYDRRPVQKRGIEATTVTVLVPASDTAHAQDHADRADTDHAQDHADRADTDHAQDHADRADTAHARHGDGEHVDVDASADARPDAPDGLRSEAEGHGPHRTLPEVVEILDVMDVSDRVRGDARAVFERLARAESAVHGTDPAETHFHEVGADDAIADVVGACLLLEDLAPDRVVTTPLSVGGGETETSHGTYPIPAPAVVELAGDADWSVRGGPVDRELLTPTGAALLAHFADGVEYLPSMQVDATGYGAGDYDLAGRPNVLRTVVGDDGGGLDREPITVLETNLDDASPELLGDLQASLAEAGALDVTVLPATMKKSRPGHLVKVVTRPADAAQVARALAAETGTLGVREHGAGHRWVARRHMETATVDVAGDAYEVSVKVATDEDGTVFDVSAEYDDAAAVARETALPLREVMRRAEQGVSERVRPDGRD